MRKIVLVLICFNCFSALGQKNSFDTLTARFAAKYIALKIPDLQLSYVEGLKAIATAEELTVQKTFFRQALDDLKSWKPGQLTALQLQDYRQITYESELALERIHLEQRWLKQKPAELSVDGIYNIPNGQNWYKYLLKKWLSANVTPDEIYDFGMAELESVKGRIEDIRKVSGLTQEAFDRYLQDTSFFTKDADEIKRMFEKRKRVVYGNLDELFSKHEIPDLRIEQGENAALAQAPGYYDNNVFYYNVFDQPFNKRSADWLFMHEAVPGHHYQSSIYDQKRGRSKVQDLFYYMGLAEGWGAYAEELGWDLGLYETPYDELGKWEWDLVRSVRVPLDVGINYKGWTDAQALEFWKKHVHGQDNIAMREIARVRRWPAQAITYKYGAAQILKWRIRLMDKEIEKFNIKVFHDKILNNGSLPLFMIEQNIFNTK